MKLFKIVFITTSLGLIIACTPIRNTIIAQFLIEITGG